MVEVIADRLCGILNYAFFLFFSVLFVCCLFCGGKRFLQLFCDGRFISGVLFVRFHLCSGLLFVCLHCVGGEQFLQFLLHVILFLCGLLFLQFVSGVLSVQFLCCSSQICGLLFCCFLCIGQFLRFLCGVLHVRLFCGGENFFQCLSGFCGGENFLCGFLSVQFLCCSSQICGDLSSRF